MLKNNQTYRTVAAFILAASILQVFVLQGLHHVVGHDHDEPVCDVDSTHLHAEGHGHFTCDLCLFHFAPADLAAEACFDRTPAAPAAKSLFTCQSRSFSQILRQFCLRGPPVAAA